MDGPALNDEPIAVIARPAAEQTASAMPTRRSLLASGACARHEFAEWRLSMTESITAQALEPGSFTT